MDAGDPKKIPPRPTDTSRNAMQLVTGNGRKVEASTSFLAEHKAFFAKEGDIAGSYCKENHADYSRPASSSRGDGADPSCRLGLQSCEAAEGPRLITQPEDDAQTNDIQPEKPAQINAATVRSIAGTSALFSASGKCLEVASKKTSRKIAALFADTPASPAELASTVEAQKTPCQVISNTMLEDSVHTLLPGAKESDSLRLLQSCIWSIAAHA